MPVRGAGYPEGAFAMERVLDRIARRARPRPRRGAAAQSRAGREDALHHAAEDALRLADHARQRRLSRAASRWRSTPSTMPALPRARRRARAEGRYLGIGVGNGVKGTGRGPFESGIVRDRPLRPHLGLHRRDADGAGHQDRAGADLRRAVRRVAGRRHGDRRRHRGHPARPGRLRQPPDHHRGLGGAHGRRRGAREGAQGRGASARGERRAIWSCSDGRDRRRRRAGRGHHAAGGRRGGVGRAGLSDAGQFRARASKACRTSCPTR